MADLDSCFPAGYAGRLPAGSGTDLRAAAIVYNEGLAPASAGDRHRVLLGLRSATAIRLDGEAEADASLNLLRAHLEDVPLDILQTACRSYCNTAGTRFFPRSAGEIRVYTNPLMFERKSRAFRLRWLADQADREDAERERLAADPLIPAAIDAIKAEFGLGEARKPVAADPARMRSAAPAEVATVDKYLALGLTEDEARQAVADHERLLSRSKARPAGRAMKEAVGRIADAA